LPKEEMVDCDGALAAKSFWTREAQWLAASVVRVSQYLGVTELSFDFQPIQG
jgi:hypothetical protein